MAAGPRQTIPLTNIIEPILLFARVASGGPVASAIISAANAFRAIFQHPTHSVASLPSVTAFSRASRPLLSFFASFTLKLAPATSSARATNSRPSRP
eukprot:1088458-Pyramimonas_sp.AAC.1